MSGAKIVFGAGGFTSSSYPSSEEVKTMLDVIEEQQIKVLDTAALYGESEQYLGEAGASNRFTIDTKNPGYMSKEFSTKDVVIASGQESLKKLKTTQVDVYYIHAPDTRVPFEQTLEGIHALYQAGAFKRFGLSNFSPDQTKEVLRICKERGFVAPTVYQGNYNAVARRAETDLFPLLREHGISFYAYSPIAGGFLAKTPEQLRTSKGRWDPDSGVGRIYRGLYSDKPATMAALVKWHEVAEAEGVSGVELAYRWVVHNSILDPSWGDAVVIGSRGPDQLRGTMAAIRKGPLSAQAQAQIQAIWESIEPESFLDNFEGYVLEHGFSPKGFASAK